MLTLVELDDAAAAIEVVVAASLVVAHHVREIREASNRIEAQNSDR